ncbi:hypothetical protein HU200_061500 [Digitaria exilis]|uniref:Dof zinc finger protein n=1 Tax=Digitaria exilis TaxID=1010633 RepID=A0A835A433_9POAL|nr:hypothetical protein HU200_061500 [Digitaria exilis]
MQETAAVEPGRRPAQQQFAGVDLRRPKGYAAPAATVAVADAVEGDPCPRCESRDTKFCYYNNYNTSQPRHFCKGCRRYWTKGGTLRNVPVGGGTRKKPSSSSSSSSSYAAAAHSDKPKKPSKKKRRIVVAATPEPAAAPVAASVSDPTKTATNETATTTTSTKATAGTPTTTDAASEITTHLVVPAAAVAEEEDSLAHLLQPDVALGLGISEFPSGKEMDMVEPDSFEWPAAFDLGTCWGSAGGFADTDPAGLFLNLP